MGITDESLAELFEQYKDEVRETIGTLDTELVTIEQDPGDSEVIFSIFRHLHSLKGSSKMFNVDNIGHIAHKLEDLMQTIDKDNAIMSRNPKIADLLFRGNDIFRDVISRLEEDIGFTNLTPEHAGFIEEINQQIELISRKELNLVVAAGNLVEELESLLPQIEDLETSGLRRSIDEVSANLRLLTQAEGASDIKYTYADRDLTGFVLGYESGLEKFKKDAFAEEDLEAFFTNAEQMLQALFDEADEAVMDVLRELNDGLEMYQEKQLEIDPIVIEFLETILNDLKGHLRAEVSSDVTDLEAEDPDAKAIPCAKPECLVPPTAQIKTIRVDEKKIDTFLDSVGKLITQSEILDHLQYSLKGANISPSLVRDFTAVNQAIANGVINLQKSIMEVRQVEIDNILKKFPRLVRDISRKMGKEVELLVSGERTPIDKSLLDDVEAALIHVVRNAIDHGLEMPEEREKAGKNRRGRIAITVVQEETSILVTAADDGRGIDFNSVRAHALEKGLISAEQSEEMVDDRLEQLIFKSGLTTKDEATDISGRVSGWMWSWPTSKNGTVKWKLNPGRGLA